MAKGTSTNAPVIIIKRIKKGEHAHHGGAWKVAYADFVTAMMAFFLLLWLLNVTTDIERKGIADYFAPASISKSESGAGGTFGGQTITQPGAQISDSTPINTSKAIPEPDASENGRTESPGAGSPEGVKKQDKGDVTSGAAAEPSAVKGEILSHIDQQGAAKSGEGKTAEEKTAEQKAAEKSAEETKRQEDAVFRNAEQALREAIKGTPSLADLEKNLIIDSTPEGLRIQIVDRDGYSLFSTGSATLAGKSRDLVTLVGRVLSKLNNPLSVTGHTDNTPFPVNSRRTNWQLSTERAQSSLETLVVAGVTPDRIQALIGKADREPLVEDNPSDSQNRRISIVLLRKSYLAQMKANNRAPVAAPPSDEPAPIIPQIQMPEPSAPPPPPPVIDAPGTVPAAPPSPTDPSVPPPAAQ